MYSSGVWAKEAENEEKMGRRNRMGMRK